MEEQSYIDVHRRTYAQQPNAQQKEESQKQTAFNPSRVMRVMLATREHVPTTTTEPIRFELPISEIAAQHPKGADIILSNIELIGTSGNLTQRCLLHGFVAKAAYYVPFASRDIKDVLPLCTVPGCRSYGMATETFIPATELVVGSMFSQHNTNVISIVRPSEPIAISDDRDIDKTADARMDEMCTLVSLAEIAILDIGRIKAPYVELAEFKRPLLSEPIADPVAWFFIDQMHDINKEDICNCDSELQTAIPAYDGEQKAVQRGTGTSGNGDTARSVRIETNVFIEKFNEIKTRVQRAAIMKERDKTLYIELVPIKDAFHSESHISREDMAALKSNIVSITLDIFTTSRSKQP